MPVLPSRKITQEQFLTDFLATLSPQVAAPAGVTAHLAWGPMSPPDCPSLVVKANPTSLLSRGSNHRDQAFSSMVLDLLTTVLSRLGLPEGVLQCDVTFNLGITGCKQVDFVIDLFTNKRVAFEVNFYTVSGSKLTEIKRAYADLNRHLESLGVTLVWITDGIGYQEMKRSLKDAFAVHPNTYNYHMAATHLAKDLRCLLTAS